MDANVTRAKIVNWLVREGDSISAGAPLVEIETEKAVFIIEAEAAGVVRRILVAQGNTAAVGTRLAVIGELDEVLAEEPSVAEPSIGSEHAEPGASLDATVAEEYAVPDYSDALLGE